MIGVLSLKCIKKTDLESAWVSGKATTSCSWILQGILHSLAGGCEALQKKEQLQIQNMIQYGLHTVRRLFPHIPSIMGPVDDH